MSKLHQMVILLTAFTCLQLQQVIISCSEVEVETLVSTQRCKNFAQNGDHLMLSYEIKDEVNSEHIYSLPPHKHLHVELGHVQLLPGLSVGLQGACKGETRYIKIPQKEGYSADKEYLPDIGRQMWEGVEILGFNVTVHYLTSKEDYQIFELYSQKEYMAVVDMLNDHKGNNAVDQWGASLMMYAVQDGQTLIMATLLNSYRPKSDVNIAKASGHTALIYAVLQQESKFMRALLKMGADPNVFIAHGEKAGWTPLHFACSFEFIQHAKLLLEFGADPFAETHDGKLPLDLLPASMPKGLKRKVKKVFDEATSSPTKDL